jgi:DNA mismatch repair protein PMS2
MTAEEKMIVRDHIAVFQRCGFDFACDEEEVRLTCFPFSKNKSFGKYGACVLRDSITLACRLTTLDIFEMINMLREDPSLDCRPSGMNTLFASRACRRSVMFGDPLKGAEMKRVNDSASIVLIIRQIVKNMATLKNPWCCPHGR